MIKIEYWNTYNILDIHYEDGYKNWFWLDVDVMKPQYIVERDATENSVGDAVNSFMKWSKQYSFDVYCLEPLVDALTTITMHDNIWVTLPNGYTAKCKDFLTDVAWTDINNLCKVSVTFVTNSYLVSGSQQAGCE